MNNVSKKIFLVIASAALVFAAGCSKKPKRPDPSQTLGQSAGPNGNGGDNLSVKDVTTPPDLQQRNDGFDPTTGQNRTALQPVYFDYDRSAIKQAERAKLLAAKDYLEKNPDVRLLIEGHCDWHGTAEYNLGLGDRRANEAKKFLLSVGVPADKIETLSKGSLEAVKNADDKTSANDRRDDLVVVKAGAAGAAVPAAGQPAAAPAKTP